MDLDIGGVAQRRGNGSEQGPSPFRRACEVDIIQVGEQVFAGLEFAMHLQQSTVLAHGVQGGHERVALLAPFSLLNFVGGAGLVIKKVRAGLSVELAHVRGECSEAGVALQALEHAAS